MSISPNILYLTPPITTFMGRVEKIEGNKITFGIQQNPLQNIPPATAVTATPIPTPKLVTITFQAGVSANTQIYQPAATVPYILKSIAPSDSLNQKKLSIKDIKVGQYISVNSSVDLRMLTGNTFEASVINLPQKMNSLSGKIVRVSGNTVMIKAIQPVQVPLNPMAASLLAQPVEKEFAAKITDTTEISYMTFGESTAATPFAPTIPKKLSLTDLKKDMQVTIYTAEDVSETTQVTALRIEPVVPAPAAPALPPVPTMSPAVVVTPVVQITPLAP